MKNITLNRINSVRDTVSEKKLKRYALDDPSEQVRKIAVSKIKDPVVLSHIVQNDKSVNVAKKAVQNIDDEYELKSLFIMMSKSGAKYDEEIYLDIINKVTDRDYLIEMINVNFFSELLGKINDKNHKISLSLKNYNKRNYPSITSIYSYFYSQNKLKKIALGKNYRYRKLAIQHITDQDFLVKAALTNSNGAVREGATKHIQNQDILVQIALTDSYWRVRLEATKRIQNQDVLVKIALTDSNYDVRRESTKRIQNQDVLVKIALKDSYFDVQIEAIKQIKNPEILLDLLLNKSGYVVRNLINKVDDQPSLLKIALSSQETKKLNGETGILYDALKKEVG